MKKISVRLPGWNFSPVWASRDAIFSPVDRAEIPHVIDKKFQHGLKMHKRMSGTLVYKNKYKKQRFSPSHSVPARAEISHVIAFFFQLGQPGWNICPGWNAPCNQPLCPRAKSYFHSTGARCQIPPSRVFRDAECAGTEFERSLNCRQENLECGDRWFGLQFW